MQQAVTAFTRTNSTNCYIAGMYNPNNHRKIVLATVLLSLSLTAIVNAQSGKITCPDIRTNKYFIAVDKKFDSCFNRLRQYQGITSYEGSATYGYAASSFYALPALLDFPDAKSLKAAKLFLQDADIEKIDFSKFPSLEYLWLEHAVKLPASIQALTKLRVLILNSNQVTAVPATIGLLPSLTVLSVAQGSRLRSISPAINRLKNLRELYLCYIDALDTLPVDFGNFKNLQRLILYGSLKNLLNPTIVKCKQLTELQTVSFVNYLSGLTQLKTLNLEYVRRKDDLSALVKLQELEEFFVSFGFDKDRVIDELYALPKLRNLSLSFFEAGENIALSKGRFENLEYLWLNPYNLAAVPDFVYQSKKLRYIKLYSKSSPVISGRILGLPELQVLSCSKTFTPQFDKSAARFEWIQ